jgi:Asp-tRNA(Asn)/Glu-tRNA(Gln) amidotransferase C subunit
MTKPREEEEEEGLIITQKYIHKTLKIPSNTKEMDLSSMNIVKGKVLEFQNLEKLNLSNNQLENVDFLRNLTKLKELNLSNNHLDKIGKIFKYLENLEKLNVSNNQPFEEIKNLKYLKNLKNLKIDIQTKEQEEEIKKLKNLKKLNGNNIKRESNRRETEEYIIESFDDSESKKEEPKKGTLINKIEMKEIGKLVGGYTDTDKSGLLELVSKKKKNKATSSLDFIFKEKKEETW